MHNILSEFSAGGIGARLALGAVAAAILGAVVGSLLGYVWLGIGLGICVGVAIAAVSSHRVRRRHGDSEPEANRRDRSGASLASRDAAGQGEATYHSVGRAAITSGAVGIVAFAFLFAAVRTRTDIALSLSSPTYLMFKAHDVGAIIQFLFLVPVPLAFFRLSKRRPPGTSRALMRTGIGAALLTALFLMLGIVLIVSDGLYTVPQAVFGLWMLVVSRQMGRVALGHLRWFGMVVGAGLVITGSFFPLFAVFVDARILQIPAVDPSDPASFPAHFTWINQHLHYLLEVGSVMGVLTLPFWTIAVGRKLLREKASEGVPVDVRPVSTPA